MRSKKKEMSVNLNTIMNQLSMYKIIKNPTYFNTIFVLK